MLGLCPTFVLNMVLTFENNMISVVTFAVFVVEDESTLSGYIRLLKLVPDSQ